MTILHTRAYVSSSLLLRSLGACAGVLALSIACGEDSPPDSMGMAGASTAGGSAGAPAGGSGGGLPAAGSSGAGTSGSPGGAGAPGSQEKLGGFVVELKSGDTPSTGFTSVSGSIYDGGTPAGVEWESRAATGGCELLVPKRPFCDPPCGADVCLPSGQCAPYPRPIKVGSVRVSGIGENEFTMEEPAGSATSYLPPSGVSIPYPPAEEGEAIRFEATGGSFGPFALDGKGIVPLVITSAVPVAIETGEPLVITWTPGNVAEARLHLELDISHHGGTKGKIECDVPDNGSVELPASMLADLIALGVAGYPTVELARRFVDSAAVPAGVVELLIVSRSTLDVTVPGLVSCSGDGDCPMGQTCRDDLRCQ